MIIPQYRAGCPHVTHPSATKINKIPAEALILSIFVRLACVKHAASVHPEPGSNSPFKWGRVSALSVDYRVRPVAPFRCLSLHGLIYLWERNRRGACAHSPTILKIVLSVTGPISSIAVSGSQGSPWSRARPVGWVRGARK